MDDAVWPPMTFTKNRDRLLEGDIARAFFEDVVAQARGRRLLSAEHFTVDGTLLEAWGRSEELQTEKPSPAGGLTIRVIRWSISTGSGARIRGIGPRPIPRAGCSRRPKATKPSSAYLCEELMENRHGLVVDACVVPATGTGERRWRDVNSVIVVSRGQQCK